MGSRFVLLGRTEGRRSMGGVKRESGKEDLYCLVGQGQEVHGWCEKREWQAGFVLLGRTEGRRSMGGVKRREWEAGFVLLGRTEGRRSTGGVKRDSGKQDGCIAW